LESAAKAHRATAVFLGHTADDQAETVLLGLARGSGARALAGMPASRGIFHRPLLELPRVVVRSAYPELKPWRDPHNEDPRFARSRVRHRVLPLLEQELGPGVAAALARSAAQVRAEVEALDAWAEALTVENVQTMPDGSVEVDAAALGAVPAAVVTRIMRTAAIRAGASGAALTSVHLTELTALVRRWHGQGPVYLPGSVLAERASGTVVLGPGATRDPSATSNQ
jgi:tRNA(Ile)-lysidine synthase